MSENDWGRPGHLFRWLMLGIVILLVLWFAVSLIFFVTRSMQNSYYYPFHSPFFFPSGFLFGLFVIFIVFGALRWMCWPWGWGYRRRYWRYRDESYYILRERYAIGEITKEQYEKMMQDLQKHPNP